MKFKEKPLNQSADASRGGPESWRERFSGWISAVVTLAILGIATWGFSYALASFVPPSFEAQVFQWGDIFGDELPDHPEHERAQRIFGELVAQANLRDLPFRLSVVDMATPNAFTVPGGRIFVTDELFEECESNIGLAFVLAHELGHQRHRHTLKGLSWALLSKSVLRILGINSGANLKLASSLLGLKFSRSQEIEADDFAMELIQRTYGTTEGALELFENLVTTQSVFQKEWKGFLSTHPDMGERIKRFKKQSP